MTPHITTVNGDVRGRRLAAGLSQQELAKRAHCSLASLRLFDRGYRPPHSETLGRVEAVLDELERKAAGFRLEPGVGVSCYRGDTDGPEAA
jgi:transcriptional regulator with XRE-family HTH domain